MLLIAEHRRRKEDEEVDGELTPGRFLAAIASASVMPAPVLAAAASAAYAFTMSRSRA